MLWELIHLWPTLPAAGRKGATTQGRGPRQGTTASKLEKLLTLASGTTL